LNAILRQAEEASTGIFTAAAEVGLADAKVTNRAKSLANVDPDEVRALLRRYGFTDSVVINVVVYSTVVLGLVLTFLYLGYTSVIVDFNMTNAIFASVTVLSSCGAVAKSNLPRDDGGRSIVLIVNFLVDEWQKAQMSNADSDRFTFDTQAQAFQTLQRAREFHERLSGRAEGQ